MNKAKYTVKTEGSRTVVQWRDKIGKDLASRSSSGRFVEAAPKTAHTDAHGARAKKKAR